MKFGISDRQVWTYVMLALLFGFMIYFGLFSHIRFAISDNLQGGNTPLDNIVVIAIDDYSIQNIGRWPWDRDVYAELLKELEGARVVGFDLSFFEESQKDGPLIESLVLNENVVMAAEINSGQLYKPIFDVNYGYANIVVDSDGIARSIDSRIGLEEGVLPFAFEVYKNGWGIPPNIAPGKYDIDFQNVGSFETVSFFDVLEKGYDASDKFVLIGATAPNLHDTYFVPTSSGLAMAGVEVHANILQNLILGTFVKQMSVWSVALIALLFGALGLFVISKLPMRYSILIVLGLIFVYVISVIFVFNQYGLAMDLFFIPLALIVFTGVGQGVNYLEERKEKQYLTGAFGKYISRDLLSQIVDRKSELKLGGEKREITVFFSDIRGFTTISEGLCPYELVELVNKYLTEMTEIILKYNGTVDKFIGDAVMAFWNAPLNQKNHAILGCEAAIAQITALRKLRPKWVKMGYPEVHIGCGLHTGDAVVGNMGSENRFDYTAMGDTINLGARLEGLTKNYGVAIIISEDTYKLVKNKFKCRKLDLVTVKGKTKPVTIYQLIVDYNREFVEAYEKALELYLKRKFSEARKGFEKAMKIREEKLGKKNDASCKLFIDRCEEYIKSPPEKGWGGAYVMKTK